MRPPPDEADLLLFADGQSGFCWSFVGAELQPQNFAPVPVSYCESGG
jgi:hypothetical protein